MSSLQTADYAELKAAFLELLDLNDAARQARLAELDRESPALAAALRRQLDAAEQPLSILDRNVDPSIQPRLPNYRVLRELGRGGMGVVWLAERELDDARQLVALKKIAHTHWNADDLRRFQRERRILAALDHPNIAGLVDGGSDSQGQAYLATQYVEGERLDRWCATTQPDLRTRVALIRQIAAAVSYAHRQLVVHRDLKPANILVTADGVPKLLDFGIARALHEDSVTHDGPSQMTLRYAAPEQVSSEGAEGGVSIDVYALGVLLYELLTGKSPYGEIDNMSALMHAILHHDPQPPSRLPSAVAGLDADLDAICAKALRKRVEHRYASAADLLADLDRWLAREPVEARRDERGYRLRRQLRRHWPWLAAACLGLAAMGYHWHALNQQLDQVERQRDKAQALAEHFGRLFAEATPADTETGEVTARALLERSVKSLIADQERPAAVRAALLLASATAFNYLGQVQAAGDAAREAKRLALSMEPMDPDLLAAAHSELATSLSKSGDNDAARKEADAGLALFTQGLATQRSRHVTLQQQVAMFAENAGDREAALAAYQQIVDSTRGDLASTDALESFLSAQTNLAISERNTEPEQAERRLRESLALAQQHGFGAQETLIPMRAYLAIALLNQRRVRAARDVMRPNLAAARAFYGEHDPWLGLMLNIAGKLAAMDGDHELGDDLLAESERITAHNYGADHPNTRASQADRAIVSVLAEDWPEAERRLDAMLAWLSAQSLDHSELAWYMQAARAYVHAHRQNNGQNIAAALEALQQPNVLSDRSMRWNVERWTETLQQMNPQRIQFN